MKTDICIVGGGIMGLATAYNLTRTTDSEILLLDRYGIPNDYSASNDVNRVFRYSYGNDKFYTDMAVESLRLWKQLEKESGQQLLTPTGLLLLDGLDKNSNKFAEASYKTLTQANLGTESLDSRELRSRYPQFKAEKAILDLHGGVLLASKALQILRELAQSLGVRMVQRQVDKIVRGEKPHLTTTDNDQIDFRKILVTTGQWSNSLLDREMPRVKPTRQQLFYIRPSIGIDTFLPGKCPVFFTDSHYGLPAVGIDAVKISPKELPEEVNPETANRSVDQQQLNDCRDACRKFIPALADGELVKSKVCIYDMTENSDFVLDQDPGNPDMVYGYGFSGHGFKFAPLVGKLLAQLTLGQKPSFDLDNFSIIPSRRRAPTIGSQLGKGE
ncbi:MAG TPA: FAD-dependent oxidoreductase [Candidatus Bathyarchaeia archaeon]|nr:FAD-dependent oxidoreductase [Candidatus Bathyarchaeia archaeon]